MVIYNLLQHRSIAECLFWTFLRVWLDVLDGKIARECPADAWWRVPFGVFGAQHGGVFDSLCDTIGSLALLGTIVFIELDNKVSREPPTIVGLFVTQCSFV